MIDAVPVDRPRGSAGPAVTEDTLRGVVDQAREETDDDVGLAFAPANGTAVRSAGAWRRRFLVQSISKVFSLVLVAATGDLVLWQRVRREPSLEHFRSAVPIDAPGALAPNPFTNAGALVVTDRLITLRGSATPAVLELLRSQAGPDAAPFVDISAAQEELDRVHRNRALAHLLFAQGLIDHPAAHVLTDYTRHCAVSVDCAGLARGAGFLARGGRGWDGRQLLSAVDTRRVNSLMLTCGAYRQSTELAFRIGLPLKTGIGGGVLAVIPGVGTVCARSDRLDADGTPLAAVAALETLARTAGWSVF